MPKLTLADIEDRETWERERPARVAEVIALKRRRRVTIGERITLVFENAATIRFQIQEVARMESLDGDAQLLQEIADGNPLIPEPGELAATLFVELTGGDESLGWLSRLSGIECEVEFRLASASGGPGGSRGNSGGTVAAEETRSEIVRCVVDPTRSRALARTDAPASVHYVHFAFTPEQVEAFAAAADAGTVRLATTHAEHPAETTLVRATTDALLHDLRFGG